MTQKLYLADSYLLETVAQVVELTEKDGGFDVVLDRTVLFPASGGQPSDRGWLGDEPVLDVRLEGERVVHRTAHPPPERWVECRVERELRLDHMQQHSGQHLLSRVLEEIAGTPTVGFHLGAASATVDVPSGVGAAGRPLEEDVLLEAERAVNAAVREGLPIRVRPPTASEMASAPKDLLALSAGELRIIDMHGLDRSFCCGTHLRSTAEIGSIKVLGMERRGAVARIEFLCGRRCEAHHEKLHRAMTQLTRKSSARPEEVASYLEGVLAASEGKSRQLRALQGELARTRAELLALEAGLCGAWRVASLVQTDGSAEDLRMLAERLSAHHGCLFVGGQIPAEGDKGVVVIGSPAGSGLHAGKLLGEVLGRVGGRGGGRPELAQGGAPRDRVEEIVGLAVAEIRNRFRPQAPVPAADPSARGAPGLVPETAGTRAGRSEGTVS